MKKRKSRLFSLLVYLGGILFSFSNKQPDRLFGSLEYVTKPCLFYRWILENGYLPKIISTKHSLLYFFRNIRWLSALISTSYGRNPACISPSAFFKSWTPLHQKPWSRSIWSWSTSCGFQISSFITSRPLRLDGAIKEFQGFRCIFVIPIPPGQGYFLSRW